MRRFADLLFAGLVLAGLAVIAELVLRAPQMDGTARAVDGDTLELAGAHVRLQGIDAPELHQSCTRDGGAWACGEAARTALAKALQRGPVTCTYGERDIYDRPLARCAVAGEDLGALLVAQGLAVGYRSRDYARHEAEARAHKRGIWAGSFERPADYRAAHPR